MEASNDLALFLGMLCGDGNLSIHTKKEGYKSYSVDFCNTEKYLVDKFSNLFNSIFKIKGNIHSTKRINRKELFYFTSYSKEAFGKIVSLGFPIGVKRDVLRIPLSIREGSDKEKFLFLFGLYLTDGHLKKGIMMYFHTGSKLLLEDISEIINSLFGVNKKIKTYIQRGKFLSYQLGLNKAETREILSAHIA